MPVPKRDAAIGNQPSRFNRVAAFYVCLKFQNSAGTQIGVKFLRAKWSSDSDV
jgi:hypothetical protein